MKRFLPTLFVACVLTLSHLAGAGQPEGQVKPAQAEMLSDDLIALGQQVELRVGKLRQLKVHKPIRWKIAQKDFVRAYLKQTLGEQYAEGEMAREGLALTALGLFPAQLDYQKFILTLYEEQVGGFYDPKAEIFYLADWIAPAMQETIIAHELTHALQDQNFDIDKFIERQAGDSDSMLARAGLVEGGATMVMMLDAMRHTGMEVDPAMLDLDGPLGSLMIGMSAAQFPEFAKAPRAFREMMMFPYLTGLGFVAYGRKRGGWSRVDKVYSDLPQSSEQIMHPHKYFLERDNPQQVDLTPLAAAIPETWEQIYEDVLGEFMSFQLLDSLAERAEEKRAAAGWDGDRFRVFRQGDQLAWFSWSVWDSERDAVEFAGAFAQTVVHRHPGFARQALTQEPRLLWTHGDGRAVLVARLGQWVLVVDGFSAQVCQELLRLAQAVRSR